ncbi:MAG: hypothetical protein KC438_06600 [Thermomicrobiales bacterium]|nr:hypothetical protein [Thermomicrobiales bacterium]MCO5221023.1 hypothetical protein [Thermomicrobiales bacterium]
MGISTPSHPQRFWTRFDRRSFGGFLIAAAGCLVLVLFAWLVSRNAPSSTTGLTDRLPIPAVSANDGCANFGTYWTETSGAGIDPAPLEMFTNCRLTDDGEWVAAGSMYGGEPIDRSSLTADQIAQLDALHVAIAEQVDRLEATLPNSVDKTFDQLYSAEPNAVVGNFREGISWGSYRTRYARIVNAAMLDPDNAELADFIGWTMARKIRGYADFRRACLANADVEMLHGACRGMEDNLSIRYAPLPWVLRDPDLIDTWFYETVVKPAAEAEESA